ncbi:hypothetical protein NPIL_559131 [Nephila pilipes]|uniref:YjeF N-terminal domain-containing protein n=1 Tax=Nephila pilipes TaxID=299642 RepID=A0A8X6N8J0_NEPPI|nr:hypothetical protein NPIL_559131 [Nephila pilipes]
MMGYAYLYFQKAGRKVVMNGSCLVAMGTISVVKGKGALADVEEECVQIEEKLLNDLKYSIVQLIEVEGFAVASAIVETFPVNTMKKKEILVCIGAGKNGAVGLVCTRYLKIFSSAFSQLSPNRLAAKMTTGVGVGQGETCWVSP